jgi:hypothetical protein
MAFSQASCRETSQGTLTHGVPILTYVFSTAWSRSRIHVQKPQNGTGPGKPFTDGQTDTAGRTGHHNHLSPETLLCLAPAVIRPPSSVIWFLYPS